MMKKLIVVVVACLAVVFAQQPQCPFSRAEVEKLDFRPTSSCMFAPNAVTQTACDACACSFVDATLPLWSENLVDCTTEDFGADSAVASTFNNLMTSCMTIIGSKLSRDLGVNLFQLPRLFAGVQSCPADVPPPMCLVEAMATVCPSNSPVMATLIDQISAAPMMEI